MSENGEMSIYERRKYFLKIWAKYREASKTKKGRY
jgi:hypothetical protein